MPVAVTMPWTVGHPAAPGGKAPGQHGGWLGKGFDPFSIMTDPNAPDFQVDGLAPPEGVDAGSDAQTVVPSAKRWPSGIAQGDLPGTGPRTWDGFQTRASTRWLRPRHAVHSRSSARTRGSATATAGTSTASACSWLVGWSRRASPW